MGRRAGHGLLASGSEGGASPKFRGSRRSSEARQARRANRAAKRAERRREFRSLKKCGGQLAAPTHTYSAAQDDQWSSTEQQLWIKFAGKNWEVLKIKQGQMRKNKDDGGGILKFILNA